MFGWFADNLFALWFVAFLLLALIEVVLLDFFCLMLSLASLAAPASSFFTDSFTLQVLTFALTSLLLLLLIRPKIIGRLHKNTPQIETNTQALLGQQAVSLEAVTQRTGLIRLAGDTWTARVLAGQKDIPPGLDVRVARIDGATAYVEPLITNP